MTSIVYWPGKDGFPAEQDDRSRGAISCYAWGDDYHEVFGDKIKALGQWLHERCGGNGKYYVDTGAVLERDMAERAGMGFVGKNTLLINERLGSGMFLGALFTTLPLYDKTKRENAEDEQARKGAEQAPPKAQVEVNERGGEVEAGNTRDKVGSGAARAARRAARKEAKTTRGAAGCGSCARCQVACPTNAFVSEYVLDATKCISYLTIEHKGGIPKELRRMMGNKIYGCDICQQVCPWNRYKWSTKRMEQVDHKHGAGVSPLFGPPQQLPAIGSSTNRLDGSSTNRLDMVTSTADTAGVAAIEDVVDEGMAFGEDSIAAPSLLELLHFLAHPLIVHPLIIDSAVVDPCAHTALEAAAAARTTRFRERFFGSAIVRVGPDKMLRNVIIALGNSADKCAIAPLEELAMALTPPTLSSADGQIDHSRGSVDGVGVFIEPAVLQEHAEWAVRQLHEDILNSTTSSHATAQPPPTNSE
jgi:epoxyqueuosine reductase QueG